MRRLAALLAAVAIVGVGCTSDNSDDDKPADKTEQETRDDNYENLAKAEPIEKVTYPMNRITINGYTRTWNRPGALSYNYIGTFDSDGNYKVAGYYILKGLPVSYCATLSPPEQLKDVDHDGLGPNLLVKAPGADAVFYSGGDCQRYYGFDATTGQYIEYTVPMVAMVRVSDQPIDNIQGAQPLGPSTIEEAEAVRPEPGNTPED